jgi:diguanylate cyclase (GGDEF)-like protein
MKIDQELFENLVETEAQELAEEFQRLQSLDQLKGHLTKQQSDRRILLLINKDYRAINFEPRDSLFLNGVASLSLMEVIAAKENSGRYTYENQLFIWAKSKINGTEYTAAHIYAPAYNVNQYSSKLAIRLLILAMIIFWVAIWAALIISTAITRRIKEQQTRIQFQADHDALTGLKNRYFLANKLNELISSHKDDSFTVIIIAIDRFTEINHTLGHIFSDLLLKEFGRRMQTEFWSNDTVARFGSGQYSLLLPLTNISDWKVVIEKIERILIDPFLIQDLHIIADVNIGVSVFPQHASTAIEMLRCAEVAMYMANKSGTLYEFYNANNDPNSIDRLQLISELNYAIDKDEFELHFQPKVDIEKHELIGCEALLRWNNGARGRIPPDIFIPLAE